MDESVPRRFTYSTIDATYWRESRSARHSEKKWWVAMLCNENGGEHTKTLKTNDPHTLQNASPIREGSKSWALSNLLLTESEECADAVIELLEAQKLRGSVSKATLMDVLGDQYALRHYQSFSKIFKIPEADDRLERVSGKVTDT